MRPASIGSNRLMHRNNVDLPEPDAPIEADHLVVGHLEIHAAQDLEGVEPLAHPVDQDGLRHKAAPVCLLLRRCRPTSQSVNRVSGIVITRKHSAAPRIGVKLKSPLW